MNMSTSNLTQALQALSKEVSNQIRTPRLDANPSKTEVRVQDVINRGNEAKQSLSFGLR